MESPPKKILNSGIILKTFIHVNIQTPYLPKIDEVCKWYNRDWMANIIKSDHIPPIGVI